MIGLTTQNIIQICSTALKRRSKDFLKFKIIVSKNCIKSVQVIQLSKSSNSFEEKVFIIVMTNRKFGHSASWCKINSLLKSNLYLLLVVLKRRFVLLNYFEALIQSFLESI